MKFFTGARHFQKLEQKVQERVHADALRRAGVVLIMALMFYSQHSFIVRLYIAALWKLVPVYKE